MNTFAETHFSSLRVSTFNSKSRKISGFTVEEIPYAEIAKQEGLLRCSTLPLIRD